MAEVVSLVVGVVSLGVQLAESVQKVKRFYNTVKDAPERLADIVDEIESLSDILTEMEGDRNAQNTNVGPKMQRCVATCRKAVDKFTAYADGLESRMKRHGRRGNIKFAVKSESIEAVISRLESSKSNLVLAYMMYREAVADERAAQMQQQMDSMVVGQALLLHQASAVPATQSTSNNRLQPIPGIRNTTITRLSTPNWLGRTVRELAIARAISGWTFSLRSRRVIPFKTPVGRACYFGDTLLLQQLLNRREASPFDVIESQHEGFGPSGLLEIAVVHHHTDMVRLLIAASENTIGVDPSLAANCWEMSFISTQTPSEFDRSREHFRYLVEQCDNDDHSDTYGMTFNQIKPLVYGNPENVTLVLFWNAILRYDGRPWSFESADFAFSAVLQSVTLDGEIKYLVGHQAMETLERHGHKRDVLARSLTAALILSAVSDRYPGIGNARILKALFVEARRNGLDVYNLCHFEMSPMLLFLHSDRTIKGRQDLQTHFNAWLTVLDELGFDLAFYGQAEWDRFQQVRHKYECERPWDPWHGTELHSCYNCSGSYCDWTIDCDSRPTLFAFSYGAAISDWKAFEVHPGDQYAGQFWRLVENDCYEMGGANCRRHHVPGGWVESE